tara:strand:- start:1257 stop:1640 length:384 start_codon:yes stop_codon:yes gene_type:complete
MSFSNFLELEILDHVFRNSAYTAPSTIHVALFTSAPNDAGGGTEVSGNGYARQSMAFSAASSGSISNSGSVEFPTATGSQGTITHVGLFDASSGGNLLAYGALSASKTVDSGDVFRFNASSVTISLD